MSDWPPHDYEAQPRPGEPFAARPLPEASPIAAAAVPIARPYTPPRKPTAWPFVQEPPHPMLLGDVRSWASALLELLLVCIAVVFALMAIEFAFMALAPLYTDITYSDLQALFNSGDWEAQEAFIREISRAAVLPGMAVRVLATFGIIAGFLHFRGQSLRSVGLGSRNIGLDIALGVGSVLAVYMLILPLSYLTQVLDPSSTELMEENADRLIDMLPPLGYLGFLPLMLMVAFWEELFFRGFLLTRMRRTVRYWAIAVTLCTIAFVLPHMLEQTSTAMLPIAVLSIVFCLLTIWRKSIWPAVVGHFLFNYSQAVFLVFMMGDRWQ